MLHFEVEKKNDDKIFDNRKKNCYSTNDDQTLHSNTNMLPRALIKRSVKSVGQISRNSEHKLEKYF